MKKLLLYFSVILAAMLASCTGDVVKNETVDLSLIDPGEYDASWWNRKPYRLVQTNLREIDATMDVDAYVQSMVDANVNIVLINVGGIVANYPTKLPFHFRNTFMKGDLVGDLVAGLHAKGIRVIGRFDFSKINESLAAHKPEWLYVSTKGRHVNYNGQVHTCVNGEYQQEYSIEILKEALSSYPFDGVFFNMIGYTTSDYSGNNHGICQCENCKKRFSDFAGHTLPVRSDMNDPVFREYNHFKKVTSEELFTKISNSIKTVSPQIMINTYTDVGVNMIASESSTELFNESEWNYSATDNVKRILGSYSDRSPGNLLIYFQAIGYRHIGMSPNLAKVWMLENMLHGAPLGFVVVGTLVNYEDRIFIPTLNNLYGFHKAHEKLFTNIQSANNVALIRGSRDEYQGIIKLLTEEHIMYDIIEPSAILSETLPRKLEEYEALILGDITNMSFDLINRIDEYVHNGGKVLTTGFTSTKDEFGEPLNALRLKSLGVNPTYDVFMREKSSYLKISDKDKQGLGANEFKEFTLMMMYSDFMKCQLEEKGIGYMRFLPDTKFGPPEKAYYTDEEISDFPGLIYNSYGKGRSVFIPWKLGAQYRHKGHYMHRRLFASALHNLLKIEQTLQTNASPLIEMTHLVNRNGAFEWIGMINHSGQIGGSYRESVSVYDTQISFKPQRPVRKIFLLNAGLSVKFEQKGENVECILPQINDFEMLLCLYD
jgi:hypothetical protein